MKFFSITLIFLIIFQNCKQVPKSTPEDIPTNDATEKKSTLKIQEREVRTEIGLFDAEWESFKSSIEAYRSSENYLNPGPDDEVFNQLIEAIDLLEKDQVIEYIEQKKFTSMYEKINTKLPEYELLAKQMMTDGGDNNALNLANTSSEDDTTTKEDGDGDKKEKKSSLLQGTAIFMIVMGSLGLIGNGTTLATDLARGKLAKTSPNLKGSSLSGLQKYRYGSAVVGLGLASFALIVGAMIVSDDEPSESKINSAKAYLGVSAGLFAVSALGGAYLAASPGAAKKLMNQIYDFNYKNQMALIELKTKSKTPLSPFETKLMKQTKADFLLEMGSKPGALTGARVGAGIGALIAAGFAGGLAYWSTQLELTNSESVDPKTKTMSKISRAFIAFQEIEYRS